MNPPLPVYQFPKISKTPTIASLFFLGVSILGLVLLVRQFFVDSSNMTLIHDFLTTMTMGLALCMIFSFYSLFQTYFIEKETETQYAKEHLENQSLNDLELILKSDISPETKRVIYLFMVQKIKLSAGIQ